MSLLITGAAQGVGAALAKYFAQQGFSLILHYRKSSQKVEAVAQECRQYGVCVQLVQGNFSSKEGTEAFIEMLLEKDFSVRHLINNVGAFAEGSTLSTSSDRWYEMFQVNVHTPFLLAKALVPTIEKQAGTIINIGSIGARGERADCHYSVHTLTKRTLYHLTTALAKELAPKGVRVNMVSPGELENSVTKGRFTSQIPMGREGKLSEVVAAVAFLLSEDAHYITGQNIEVAGGFGL